MRVVLHSLRSRNRDTRLGEVLLDIALQQRPPDSIIDAIT